MNNINSFFKNKSIFSSENIFYFGLGWSVLSLFFFLLYSVPLPDEELSSWYIIGSYILGMIPFLMAGFLSFRNWLEPNIPSGRKVWLLIAIGMICYFLGDVFLVTWEVFLGLDIDISPADIFYLAFYVFVGWGIVLTVLPRRLNLSVRQWGIIIGVAILGILFAVWVNILIPQSLVDVSETVQNGATEITEEAEGLAAWVANFSDIFNFFYLVLDIILLVLASTLLLAFWGGKFSQSWRLIAIATIFLYIGDMAFQYDLVTESRHATSNLLEVFFVFSGVLFALGAAREYDLSLSSRSRSRRRR
jgi:hypothetical protein